MKYRGHGLVVLAAAQWATIGIITRTLVGKFGVPELAVPMLRGGLGALVMFAALGVAGPRVLRLDKQALPLFLIYGIVGVAGFYLALTLAIDLAGAAVATLLIYTAPAWVAAVGAAFLGEPFTRRKVISVGLVLVGCALVARVYDPALVRLNALGLGVGLLAGMGYALFQIFNKVASRRYDPRTIIAYSLLFGGVAMLPAQSYGSLTASLSNPAVWPWVAALVALPTLGAWGSFVLGLRFLPVSTASVIAAIEPVFAITLAWIFLGERLQAPQFAGGGLIVAAVVILATGE